LYDGLYAARSVLIMSDPAAAEREVPLGVIVPITAGPRSVGLLSADELTEATGPDGRLTALLDAVASAPRLSTILAVDPAVLASIRVLGSAAPTVALDWLDRLDGMPNERFALQF